MLETHDVRADERINVLDVELTVTWSVNGPSSVVADQRLFDYLCEEETTMGQTCEAMTQMLFKLKLQLQGLL